MSQDERKTAGSPPDVDPLEEQTQPLFDPRRASDAAPDSDDVDTTVVMHAQAPPVLDDAIEEQATVMIPPEPEPEPEPEPDSAPAAEEPHESTERVDAGPEAAEEEDAAAAETVVAAGAAAEIAEASARSQIAPSSSLHPLLLERIEPSLGRGERVRLDAAHWQVSLGRGEQNDLRLYTASASREHAVIAGNEAGEWVLTPTEGKAVKIDGDPTTEPIVLEVGMNLVMGGDHLRCVTEGLDRGEMTAQTAADFASDDGSGVASRHGAIGLSWWLIGAVALIGVGLIAFAWFGG